MRSKEKSVAALESAIRDFINRPRKHWSLLQEGQNFNIVCSCLDVIGDTELAIDSYLALDTPADVGERYLLVYGILQVLSVQQDAVKTLSKALSIQYTRGPDLKKIRDIRIKSIGHPAETFDGSSNFISRVSLDKLGFQLLTTYNNRRGTQFSDVNITELISIQREALAEDLTSVIHTLRKEEMAHRRKFRNKKLEKIFPEALEYYFGKISEACYGGDKFYAGLPHVKLVLEVLEELKGELERRVIFEAYEGMKYHFDEVDYPLSELQKYFDRSVQSKLNRKDAYIFAYFVEQQMDTIKKMAREIDEEYSQDL